MQKFYAKGSCGCCIKEMFFEDLNAATKAFSKAGLSSSVIIIDDNEIKHDVDTFYGFSEMESEFTKSPLIRLANQLNSLLNLGGDNGCS
jgi:aromatic ring-opening dioxygenase LigB subunit